MLDGVWKLWIFQTLVRLAHSIWKEGINPLFLCSDPNNHPIFGNHRFLIDVYVVLFNEIVHIFHWFCTEVCMSRDNGNMSQKWVIINSVIMLRIKRVVNLPWPLLCLKAEKALMQSNATLLSYCVIEGLFFAGHCKFPYCILAAEYDIRGHTPASKGRGPLPGAAWGSDGAGKSWFPFWGI